MSNVLPFRRHEPPELRRGCDVVSVADDLFEIIARIEDLAGRAAAMNRPSVEVERTVQNLLDALGATERALDCLGEGNEAAPA